MPPTDSDYVDTSRLTPEALRELLPASGSELYHHGSLVLELVVEETEDEEELRSWLEVCSPIGADSASRYVLLDRPIPAMYQGEVDAEGVRDDASAHFRGFDVPEFGFEARNPRRPRLVVRPLRTINNDHVLLLFWRRAWAYPVRPEPRGDDFQPACELPGVVLPPTDISDAIARGVPAKQARFAKDWGGLGPRLFDDATEEFDREPSVGSSAIGEALIASVVSAMKRAVSDGLTVAHDQWETDLLADLRDDEGEIADDARQLAVLGGVAGLLREAVDELSEPYDHAERYWYAKTPDSPSIDDGLPDVIAALNQFTERLRTSLALASAVTSSRTLRLQQRADEQTARFQTAITALGSLLVGPTLVVGFFGANVPLPLGDTWFGFGLMMLLMGVTAYFIWRFLGSLRST